MSVTIFRLCFLLLGIAFCCKNITYLDAECPSSDKSYDISTHCIVLIKCNAKYYPNPHNYFTGRIDDIPGGSPMGDRYNVLVMVSRNGEEPECVNDCNATHSDSWTALKKDSIILGIGDDYYFGVECVNPLVSCSLTITSYKFNNIVETPTPIPIHTYTPKPIPINTQTPEPIHTHTQTPEPIHTQTPEPIHTHTPTPREIPVWSGYYYVQPGCNKDVCCCIEYVVDIVQRSTTDFKHLEIVADTSCNKHISAKFILSDSDYEVAFFNSSAGDYRSVLVEYANKTIDGIQFHNIEQSECSFFASHKKPPPPSPSPTPFNKYKHSPWPLTIVVIAVVVILGGAAGGVYLWRRYKLLAEQRPLLMVQ